MARPKPRLALDLLKRLATQYPVVTVTGPRQSGKSTLCHEAFPKREYADLDDLAAREFAVRDPREFLSRFENGAVIDEVQHAPDLLPYLKVLVDRDPTPGKWILTGSQSLAINARVSETLAGRTAFVHLLPLTVEELRRFRNAPRTLDRVVLNGGYPTVYARGVPAGEWMSFYIQTYIERDVQQIVRLGDLSTFRRFMGLCAGRTSQLLNMASLAVDTGITSPTVSAWLSAIEASFIATRLGAYSTNIRKRLVKAPKLHLLDSGLVCWFLGIRTVQQLQTHPLRGPIFESWVTSEIMKRRYAVGENRPMYFWRDQNGVECDLVIEGSDALLLVEIKASRTASGDLLGSARRVRDALASTGKRIELLAVYAGDELQRRSDGSLVPWSSLHEVDWVRGLPTAPRKGAVKRRGR